MLEIYYGDAKIKDRLCIGVAITAALRDKNVLLVNFRQDVANYDKLFDVAPHLTRLTLAPHVGVRGYFDHAVRMALSLRHEVLILHGIFDMVDTGQLAAGEVYEFLSNAPDSIEIICTGHTVDAKFLRIADEAVEMLHSDKES